MNTKYLLLLSVSGVIIALDQATKMYIHTQMRLSESFPVIANYFDITYVRNPGAAFGFLGNLEPSIRESFFLLMPPIALLIILMILKDIANDDRLQIFGLSLVFGGAIGNYIDRLRFGYVIDFLDFHYKSSFSWPAFNVADTAIVCGVGILLVMILFKKEEEKEPNSSNDSKETKNRDPLHP